MRRKYLNVNDRIVLCGECDSGVIKRTFTILRRLDIDTEGASIICYEADCGQLGRGVLKEFYPYDIPYLERDNENQLINSGGMEQQDQFNKQIERYTQQYTNTVYEARKNPDIANIIPPIEMYYGLQNNSSYRTVYIWSPYQYITFENHCNSIFKKNEQLTEKYVYEVLKLLAALVEGVNILHKNGYIHRDIKPGNFGFLKIDNKISQTISFFDVDTLCSMYGTDKIEKMGTFAYMEPELLLDYPPNHLTDIYSIGVTLFNVLFFDYNCNLYSDIRHIVDTFFYIGNLGGDYNNFYLGCKIEEILKKSLCTRDERYQCCEEMLDDIKIAMLLFNPDSVILDGKDNPYGRWIFKSPSQKIEDLIPHPSLFTADSISFFELLYMDYLTRLANDSLFIKLGDCIISDNTSKIPNQLIRKYYNYAKDLYFDALVQKLFNEGMWNNKVYWLVLIDIDNSHELTFKYSEEERNDIIKAFAEILNNVITSEEFAARISEYRFGLILIFEGDDKKPEMVVRSIQKMFGDFGWDKYASKLFSCSAGYTMFFEQCSAFFKDGELNFRSILNSVEGVLNNHTTSSLISKYDPRKNISLIAYKNDFQNTLELALDRNELKVYYMPRIDLSSNKIVGAETILYCNDLVLNNALDGYTEYGFYAKRINHFLLEEASRQVLSWQKCGYFPLILTVNLFPGLDSVIYEDVSDKLIMHLLDVILEKLTSFNKWPTLEIALPSFWGCTKQEICKLRSLGFNCALSNFGEIYPGFPLDYIKDCNITSVNIGEITSEKFPAVQALSEYLKPYNVKIVANGIENRLQAQMLRMIGVDYGQGLLYGKPMPSEALTDYIRETPIHDNNVELFPDRRF